MRLRFEVGGGGGLIFGGVYRNFTVSNVRGLEYIFHDPLAGIFFDLMKCLIAMFTRKTPQPPTLRSLRGSEVATRRTVHL